MKTKDITPENRNLIKWELKQNQFLLLCVLGKIGIKYQPGKNTTCPYCGHKEKLSIHKTDTGNWSYHCYYSGCDKRGDVIQLYEDFLYKPSGGNPYIEVLSELSEIAKINTTPSISGDTQRREKGQTPPPLTQQPMPSPEWRDTLLPWVKHWNEWLCCEMDAGEYTEYARGYLVDRGIRSIPMLQRHLIGVNPRDKRFMLDGEEVTIRRGIVIPNFYNGELCGIRIRAVGDPSDGIKYRNAKNAKTALYNTSAIFDGCNLVIVEGEMDVLSIESVTDNVVAVTGGSATYSLKPWDIEKLRKAGTIRIIGDNDSAGKNGATKKYEALKNHPNIEIWSYPSRIKDANELLIKEGSQSLLDYLEMIFIPV